MEKIGNWLSEILECRENFYSLKNHFIEDYHQYYSSYYLTKFLRKQEKEDFFYVKKDLESLSKFLNKEKYHQKIIKLIGDSV